MAPWAPPSPEELSSALPSYAVTALLGRGGMGAVYRAVQRSLKRDVAIKVLPPTAADDELKFAERFRHEAETLARLNHPGIVHIHDFGETADGLLYLVMEYVDGTDVHRLIQGSGRLSEDYALSVASDVCDALAYAHSRGVVHRDIKPANVLIDHEGNVKVADFGLAKMVDPQFDSGLTMSNVALGTPDYVAPEVLSFGMEVDHRADLYAVGVMLYQMLTGELPRGLFKMPSQKYADIDFRLDGVICRALEPDREERYQSAIEVRAELVDISTSRLAGMAEASLVIPSPTPRRRKPVSMVVMFACIAVLLATGAWGWMTWMSPGVDSDFTQTPPAEIDLLKTVDLNRDVIAGDWFWDPGGLRSRGSGMVPGVRGGYPRVEFAHIPSAEYDFEVEFTADTGEQDAGLVFSIGGKQTALIMNIHGGTGYIAGLDGVGGAPMHMRLTNDGRPSPYFKKGARQIALVQVRNDRVTTLLDGEVIEDWTVPSNLVNGLALGNDYTLSDPAYLGLLAGPGTPVVFHRVVVRDVMGWNPSQSISSTSPASVGPVIDTTSKSDFLSGITWTDNTSRVREDAQGNPKLSVEAEGIRRVGEGSPIAIPVTDPFWRNYAVRVRHTGGAQINLRSSEENGFIYALCQGNQSLLQRWDIPKSENLILTPAVAHPAGYDNSAPHEFIAIVEDNLVRTFVDGVLAGQARDSALPEGVGAVMWVKGSLVHSVEVARLPDPAHPKLDMSFWGQVSGVNAERKVQIVEAALESINGNDLSLQPTIKDGKVIALTITKKDGLALHDLSPVSALTDLGTLFCYAPGVRDLEWLRGMAIEHLQLTHAEVEDLGVLRESRIVYLNLGTPDKPPLSYEALAGMPLRSLILKDCPIKDISFLSGMPLDRLVLTGTGLTDYAALKAFPLAEVDVDLVPERDLPILLSIPTLKKINGTPVEEYPGK
jgi:serine/threonine protein kinase